MISMTYDLAKISMTTLMELMEPEFRAGIVNGHSAVIALSTPINSIDDEARMRLDAALTAFPDLSAGLEQAGIARTGSR